jgi:hypothetical protein
MLTRRFVLSAVLAGALLLAGVPALANATVHDVWPAAQIEWPVVQGDTVVVHLGWYAATKGQVRVFLNNTTQSPTLLDSEQETVWSLSQAEVRPLWSPLEAFPEEWSGLDCPMPTLWTTWWSFTLSGEVLARPGVYRLLCSITFDQPANDGLRACRVVEGPPVPIPGLYRGTARFESTINVAMP